MTQIVLDKRARGARRLEGKIAVVTGAGQGHGRATARRMAQEGAAIMIADRHAPGAERTRDELREFGADAEIFLGDLSSWEVARDLMATAREHFGRIDIVVNNVGGAIRGGKVLWEQAPEDLMVNIQNNLLTCLWSCKAVMPIMIEQRSGAIVNFGSHAVRGTLRMGYAAAKGGVMAITTSLALEAAPYGVRVNAVVPHTSERDAGDVLISRTGAPVQSSEGRVPEWNDPHLSPIPLARPGRPEEVAAAVTFLASDDASFTTGEILCVGGGAWCRL
jgi:dihydroxycyclohexadiene carboxylate dehydrogenase